MGERKQTCSLYLYTVLRQRAGEEKRVTSGRSCRSVSVRRSCILSEGELKPLLVAFSGGQLVACGKGKGSGMLLGHWPRQWLPGSETSDRHRGPWHASRRGGAAHHSLWCSGSLLPSEAWGLMSPSLAVGVASAWMTVQQQCSCRAFCSWWQKKTSLPSQ